MSRETLLNNVTELAENQLRPLVEDIDRKGLYPEGFLHNSGIIDGFASTGSAEEGGTGYGLATQTVILREIARECGATSFNAQYQVACAWYLHRSPSPEMERKYLTEILQGGILVDTGMPDTVKHLAEIEKHNLQAVRADGGYIANGALPQMSNIDEEHTWVNTAQIDDGHVMFITDGEWGDVSPQNCSEFCTLEGTRTYGLTFKDVFIKDEDVITTSGQFVAYTQSIKAGFTPLQINISAGVIDDSLGVIREADTVHAEASRYLDDDYGSLGTKLGGAWAKIERPADLTWDDRPDDPATLKLRAAAPELALAALQSATLHAGARDYLMRSPAQHWLREAMSVAIVTPALKHLRKEITTQERNQSATR